MRTCRACGVKANKADLVRWTAVNGEIVEDQEKNLPGRGVYCCRLNECRSRLLKNKKKLKMVLRLRA